MVDTAALQAVERKLVGVRVPSANFTAFLKGKAFILANRLLLPR
jgi:hypothetical protein